MAIILYTLVLCKRVRIVKGKIQVNNMAIPYGLHNIP